MARPLWKELRQHRARDRAAQSAQRSFQSQPARFGIAILMAAAAIVSAVVADRNEKWFQHPKGHTIGFVVAIAGVTAFAVLGSYATRRVANQLGRLLAAQGGRSAGSAVRLVTTLVGILIVLLTTISLLGVSVSRILVGGAITGVVLGIAAQQSLGNLFAGIVLIIARPFTVGSRIRLRAGSLGGIIDGEVASMGLTYVVLETEDGPLYVPNLTMMAIGVVRLPDQAAARASALYVNRAVPKRPPRHSSVPQRHPLGATRTERTARLPRELVRRMRARRALEVPPTPASGATEPEAGTANPPPPAAPEGGGEHPSPGPAG